MLCERHGEVSDALKDFETRITALERRTDVEKERTDMIFKILTEIKDSISKIADKIEEIESRPNKLLWGVLGTLVGALLMAGIKILG